MTLIAPRPGMLEEFSHLNPLLVKIFPNKLTANVPNNMLGNPHFCYFASFWITVSITPFINKPDSLRDLTIFMI